METKKYSASFSATREDLWEVLWGRETYPVWTSAFAEGSKVVWKEDGKVLFLNADNEGMVSRIKKKKEPESMVFEHLGMIDSSGKEDFESEKVLPWKGSEEAYELKATEEGTSLVVRLDLTKEHQEYFEAAWPKAFEKLNELVSTKPVRIHAVVQAPVERVWDYWTSPKHIVKWNAASPDWHTPRAENDLRTGGKFSSRMEARDGSAGFDFEGTYELVEPLKKIEYLMEDGRRVKVEFFSEGNSTRVQETFDPEATHSRNMQRTGWQAILDNFKNYTEQN